MILEAVAGAVLVGSWIYHRYFESHPPTYFPKRDISVPIVEDGAPLPMLYGKTRVTSPVLVWNSAPHFADPYFEMNQTHVLGSGFAGGTGMVYKMWAGDFELGWTPLGTITGNGGPDFQVIVLGAGSNADALGSGLLEFHAGGASQVIAQDGATNLTANTIMGRKMLTATTTAGGGGLTVDEIPGYRGVLSVFLYGTIAGPPGTPSGQWAFGRDARIPNYNYEASSYAPSTYPGGASINSDASPVDILYDLWTNKRGRAGVDASSYIDSVSWGAAATTLEEEGFGLSYFWNGSQTLEEYQLEVLRTIDGVIYENPVTNKLELKLIRNDYTPSTQPQIDKSNCVELQNFSLVGRTNIINRVRVIFLDRDAAYTESSVTAENPANSTGEGERINEVVLRYLGITSRALAQKVADRELAVRSRTFMKCRAILNRTFHDITPGTAVRVTWTAPSIASVMFRVCTVSRGKLDDGAVICDLLQDWFPPTRNPLKTPMPVSSPASAWETRLDVLNRHRGGG